MYSAKPDDDEEPDYLVKYGNAAPRESDTEQTIISAEIADLNASGSAGVASKGLMRMMSLYGMGKYNLPCYPANVIRKMYWITLIDYVQKLFTGGGCIGM